METIKVAIPVFRNFALKPSLVEWKLQPDGEIHAFRGTLKPSLVEWKQREGGPSEVHELPLKPSLVEWKPELLRRRAGPEAP